MNSTNTIQVIENFGNKIDSYIQIAAEKGNQTVEHFWPLIVKQQGIEAWTFIIVITLVIIICSILLKRGIDKVNFEDKNGEITVRGVFSIIGGFGLFFSLIVLIITSLPNDKNLVTKLFNPEYAALKEVIKMIK